jgi:hypothetical protein
MQMDTAQDMGVGGDEIPLHRFYTGLPFPTEDFG